MEYLLILVIAVAMISALGRGVAKPLKDYFQANVMEVVGCMLKVGKFPNEALGLCQSAAELNISDSLASGSSGNGGSDSNRDPNDSNTGSNQSSEESSTEGNNNNGTPFRASSRRSGSGSVDESSGAPLGSNTKTIKLSNDDSDSGGNSFKNTEFLGESSDSVSIRKINKDGSLSGSLSISNNENKDGSLASASTTAQKAMPEELSEKPIAESSFAVPKEKQRNLSSTGKDKGLEFSFFGIIKWGLIIALLGMLAFFTFSQLNSIRKGMD